MTGAGSIAPGTSVAWYWGVICDEWGANLTTYNLSRSDFVHSLISFVLESPRRTACWPEREREREEDSDSDSDR